jgi:hypothetical protein
VVEIVGTTSNFNLPVDEIIEEAAEMIGGEFLSGYEARSARRSLNLLLIDLANRGHPLYHVEQRSFTTVAGTATYDLATDVLGLLDVTISSATLDDETIGSISIFDYFNLPNKTDTQGKPNLYAFDRTSSTPKVVLYFNPDAVYTIKYWAVRKHKDITQSYQLLDLHQCYLPAITCGLAYFMGLKRQGVDPSKVMNLKSEYMERLMYASQNDRDKTDIYLYPRIGR